MNAGLIVSTPQVRTSLITDTPTLLIVCIDVQDVALVTVRKEITFCNKFNLPIIGVIENMSGFVCPCCNEVTRIWDGSGVGVRSRRGYLEIPCFNDRSPFTCCALFPLHFTGIGGRDGCKHDRSSSS